MDNNRKGSSTAQLAATINISESKNEPATSLATAINTNDWVGIFALAEQTIEIRRAQTEGATALDVKRDPSNIPTCEFTEMILRKIKDQIKGLKTTLSDKQFNIDARVRVAKIVGGFALELTTITIPPNKTISTNPKECIQPLQDLCARFEKNMEQAVERTLYEKIKPWVIGILAIAALALIGAAVGYAIGYLATAIGYTDQWGFVSLDVLARLESQGAIIGGVGTAIMGQILGSIDYVTSSSAYQTIYQGLNLTSSSVSQDLKVKTAKVTGAITTIAELPNEEIFKPKK